MSKIAATSVVAEAAAEPLPLWRRTPILAVGLTAAMLALVLVPRVGDSPALVRVFDGTALVLLLWTALLWTRRAQLPLAFHTELPRVPLTHIVQPIVQLCIYLVWGWYWPTVFEQTPLFVAQVFLLWNLDALLSWSRGRAFRLGAGPLPIVLSTNIFLWFRDEHYAWQFVLVALIVFGKEFLRWQRDGRSRHVFNPSSFALAVCSLVLVATGGTDLTFGPQIATTIARPPFIYLELFLLGVVVQALFGTVLMTLGTAIVLYAFNQAYTGATGVYFFIDSNIPVAVFLGMHLLVTDPATSPRTDLGKLVFGALYGVGICVAYWILFSTGAPLFYDKLLPIPIANLCVRRIDRITDAGLLGRFTRWEAAIPRTRSNLVAMSCWLALFGTMYATGWIGAPHPGESLAFWRQAKVEGRRLAGEKLVRLVTTRAALDSPAAYDALGILYVEGDVLGRDLPEAAHWFSEACKAGNDHGCANVVRLFLYDHVARSSEDVERALAHLEQRLAAGPDGEAASLLGLAAESGRGRPQDLARAAQLYALAAEQGDLAGCKGVARAVMAPQIDDAHARLAADVLDQACTGGDAEACLLLSFMQDVRPVLAPDADSVRRLLQRACDLGDEKACAAVAERFGARK